MKTAMKVMGGVALAGCAGVACYAMINKKIRKKTVELADTMVKETKSMMK